MADAIGVASGVLALTVFAFNSSVSLYQTVHSIQTSKKAIRDLKEELIGLEGVLEALKGHVARNEERFKILKGPLFQCGTACEEFNAVVLKCTKHEKEGKTSVRDWARLTYMGGDITSFRDLIAGYKSTIAIALWDINIKTTKVTASTIEECKEMIGNTISDLNDRMVALKEAQNELLAKRLSSPDELTNTAKEEGKISSEINSTQDCLALCSQVNENLTDVKTNVFEDVSAEEDAQQIIVSTTGKVISAKKVSAATRATQWLGQMSDETLQQLVRQKTALSIPRGLRIATEHERKEAASFAKQYGVGYKLS